MFGSRLSSPEGFVANCYSGRENFSDEASDMRCYICGESWHPVSACSLYSMIFSCPLCRLEPHPITECVVYERFMQNYYNQGN